jgi:hypothetical protein
MLSTALQEIAERVVRRAQLQGSVTARDIREELTRAGEPENLWKDVLALARPSLHYRGGRYHYTPAASERVRAEKSQQQRIHEAVRELIRQHQTASNQLNRREEERVDFIQPIKVRTEDNREFTLLSRDLSPNGIRLVGTRRLLGQRVRVLIPRADNKAPWTFVVRILWTCAIGDDLFENGGAFLEAEA